MEAEHSTEYVAIPGWCGFQKEDGAVAIVGGEDALVLAQHYEPFAVYRRVQIDASCDCSTVMKHDR